MLTVKLRDLSFLTPDRLSSETYQTKVESFLKSKGIAVRELSKKDNESLRYHALNYWRINKHPYITEAAWLYAYSYLLGFELTLDL